MPKIFSIGADPEIGICVDGQGQVVPAWDITTGIKQGQKQRIPAKGVDNVDIHADGVALEYNFTPQPTSEAFSRANAIAFKAVTNFVHSVAREKQIPYTIFLLDGVNGYSKETLLHPIAAQIGCDPDYDAYSNTPDIPRVPPTPDPNGTKFFGGHIHIGYNKDLCPPWVMARFMDLFITAPLIRHDLQPRRKEYYGQAGIYRSKPYGMEYRTLSNCWVNSNDLTRRIAHNAEQLVSHLEEHPDEMFDFFSNVDWQTGQGVINKRDYKLVEQWYKATTFNLDSGLANVFFKTGGM